jgi:serine/threonine-protein kinase HipA
MTRKGKVFFKDIFAGIISETEDGYSFKYNDGYIIDPASKPISLTMPLRKESFDSNTMLPFFDGIIPEGWLLDIAQSNWKVDSRDRMGLLLLFCKDCIGAVSVIQDEVEETYEN